MRNRLGSLLAFIAAVFLACGLYPASAQSGDAFGTSVAIGSGLVVVGVPNSDSAGQDSGVVRIFSAATGVLQYQLANPNPSILVNFGTAVAISGSKVVVGTKGNGGRGGAFVYNLNGPTPTVPVVTLQNPDSTFDSRFGSAVAISGERVVVGAYGSYASRGRAYVYYLDGANPAQPVATFDNPDPLTGDQFGFSVAISGARIVVGANLDNVSGYGDAGSAYVFDLSSGLLTQPVATLVAPVKGDGDHFGATVGISGTRVIVGAPDNDIGGSNAGRVYVFEVGNGLPTLEIANPQPATDDAFGFSVAISGANVVVGAYLDDLWSTDAGNAYVYDLNSATADVPVLYFQYPGGVQGDRFGNAVAVAGSQVAVGAYFGDSVATDAGSAYIYDLNGAKPRAPVVTLSGSGTPIAQILSPASNAIISNLVSVKFSLVEPVTSSSLALLFTNGSTVRTLTLAGSETSAGNHEFTFNPASPTTSSKITSGNAVPDGVYSVSLSFQDTRGNQMTSGAQNDVRIDTVAPVITHPSSRQAEATRATGAVVIYDASASDIGGSGVASFNSTAISGTIFRIGSTTVNLKATDKAGNVRTASFVVTVQDTTAPAVNASLEPKSLIAGPTGTVVLGDYTGPIVAAASDAVGIAGATQIPPVGTVVGLGTHPLKVVVYDAAGNQTTKETTLTIAFARPDSPTATLLHATGTDAPAGSPEGAKLVAFDAPAISDSRDMVARVSMTSGRKRLAGICRVDGAGNASMLAYQGRSAADDGTQFKSFMDPVIAPGGAIAFVATLEGNGVSKENDSSVWTTLFDGSLKLALREGASLDVLDGAAIKSILSISLQNRELVALVKLKGAGVTPKNDTALLRQDTAGMVTVLLRTFPPGSQDDSGTSVKKITIFSPGAGSAGHGRWHGTDLAAKLTGTLNGFSGDAIARITTGGEVQVIITTGQNNLPGAPPEVETRTFGLPAISPAGADVAVRGTFKFIAGFITRANDGVLAHFGADGVTPIALEADPAISLTRPVWAGFLDPVVNDAGHIAFLASIRGGGITAANKAGLWWGTPSAPELIARLGGSAPDEDGNATGAKWSAINSYALPNNANAGPVFVAKAGGRSGVWGVGTDGKLRKLLGVGDSIEGKRIQRFSLLGATRSAYGVARSYNGTGSLALVATFTDRSQALIRLDLP